MGKDNVPFHTVIFPSSLIASKQGWTLLHHISTTEYLNYEGGKFSKTHGTGVFGNNAVELEKDIPSEVWRYYLIVNRPETSDSEFCWKDFANKNNNELLANLGNLIHRVLQFIYKEYNKKLPAVKYDDLKEIDIEFINEIKNRYFKYRELMNKVELKEGLKFSMEISSRGNKYLQDSKFWEEENKKSGRYICLYSGPTSSSQSLLISSDSNLSWWSLSCPLAVLRSTSFLDWRKGHRETTFWAASSTKTRKVSLISS